MNYRMIGYIMGRLMVVEGLLMALPLAVSLIYGEFQTVWAFVIPMAILFALGILISFGKPRDMKISAKEGFVTVGLSWVVASLFGCIPFIVSGLIPDFVGAFFETVSGFTTTGASVLSAGDFDKLWSPESAELGMRGIFFWRCFTNWIGGMGVLVFVLAIMPQHEMNSSRMVYIMRAEMPGPKVDKIVSTVKKTSGIMYAIYTAMTLIEVIFLLCGGLGVYESFCVSFSTAGTGGFAVWADGMISFGGAMNIEYLTWVVSIFMFLFSINFNVYFLILTGKAVSALLSEELRWFTGIVVAATVLITANIVYTGIYPDIGEAIRHAFFQVASILSTSGFATADFNAWPNLSKTLILIMMFIGACAGSTGGGMKVSRLVISFKSSWAEIGHMINPRQVKCVRFEKKPVDSDTVKGAFAYVVSYGFIFFASVVIVAVLDRPTLETSLSSVASCINNVGPALGDAGPTSNYAFYSPASLIVLSLDMLFGRLEIFPMLLLFSPSVWRGK